MAAKASCLQDSVSAGNGKTHHPWLRTLHVFLLHFYFEPKSEGQQRCLAFHGSQVSDDWARSGRWDPPGLILPSPLSLLAEGPLPDL